MRFRWMLAALLLLFFAGSGQAAMRQPEAAAIDHRGGGEANLILPDLGQVDFRGVNARTLLLAGLGVCGLGLLFGLVSYNRLRKLPVQSVYDPWEVVSA